MLKLNFCVYGKMLRFLEWLEIRLGNFISNQSEKIGSTKISFLVNT